MRKFPFQLSCIFSICILFLGVFSSIARADDATQPIAPTFVLPKYTMAVPADQRWDLEILGNGLVDVNGRQVAMGGAAVGVGYYFLDCMSVQLDATGYGYSLGHSDGAAVGVTLGLRHQLFSVYDTSFFIDISGGEIEASNNIPRGGTHLNDTLISGLGFTHPIEGNMYLIGGLHYFHLSNARSEGEARNPSFNAAQAFIGVMWRF